MNDLDSVLVLLSLYLEGDQRSRMALADFMEERSLFPAANKLREATYVIYHIEHLVTNVLHWWDNDFREVILRHTFNVDAFMVYLDEFLEKDCKYVFYTKPELDAFVHGFNSHEAYGEFDDSDFINMLGTKDEVIFEVLTRLNDIYAFDDVTTEILADRISMLETSIVEAEEANAS